jgi:hypothetical protein
MARRRKPKEASIPEHHAAALKRVLMGALRWARQDINNVEFRAIILTTAKILEVG